MKYSVQYQYRPQGNQRPLDDGELVPFHIDETTKLALLPNVGDYVQIGESEENLGAVRGKVGSRLFSYIQIGTGEVFCSINIVLDQCDDNVWQTLVKE